ncbi:hypothetical protein ES703_116859 [subsurface metagenome]
MTRVQGPLFSVTASGTIGDAITYSNWKGLPYVRSRVIPANPQYPGQVSIRDTLKAGVSAYQDDASQTADSRTSWDYYASGTGMSGFNRYIMLFILYNSQQSAPWTNPTPGDGKP